MQLIHCMEFDVNETFLEEATYSSMMAALLCCHNFSWIKKLLHILQVWIWLLRRKIQNFSWPLGAKALDAGLWLVLLESLSPARNSTCLAMRNGVGLAVWNEVGDTHTHTQGGGGYFPPNLWVSHTSQVELARSISIAGAVSSHLSDVADIVVLLCWLQHVLSILRVAL